MAWVRIDDHFDEHPKVLRAGPLGMAMQVAALCYCNRQMTDGFVPRGVPQRLLDLTGIGMRMWDGELCGGGEDADWRLIVEDLVAAGLWEETEGGWIIHDYLDYQPSRERILADREANAKRQASWRNRQRNTVTDDVTNPSDNGPVTGAPYPIPVSKESSSLRSDSSAEADQSDDIPSLMADIWTQELGDILPKPRKIDKARRSKLAARYRDTFGCSLEAWRQCCQRIRGSPHLTGDNDRAWRADLDFCLSPQKLNRILEGFYDAKPNGHARLASHRPSAEQQFWQRHAAGAADIGADSPVVAHPPARRG